MGLKDTFKGAWHRISDLEDESAAASDQASASDRIPYKDISKKLKELMKKNVDVFGRKILIPPYYTIYFSDVDRKARQDVEEVLCDELKEELYPEMRKINPDQNKREISVEVRTDSSLQRGTFRIEFSMKKESGTPQPEKAGHQEKPSPAADDEMDMKATVIERAPVFDADEQATIVQPPQAQEAPAPVFRIEIDSGNDKVLQEILKKRITIGRASQDDVVLENSDFSISRAHATLEFKDGRFLLVPNGVNGTFLNERELELKQEVAVSIGDKIRIMNYTITLLD